MHFKKSFLFLEKNFEQHIELYNDSDIIYTNYMQYKTSQTNFLKNNNNQILFLQNKNSFIDLVINLYGFEGNTNSEFNFLEKSPFVKFFKYYLIDIPQCFRHSKSLLNFKNNLPWFKFSTFLMRHGLRLRMNKLLHKTITSFIQNYHLLNYSILRKN